MAASYSNVVGVSVSSSLGDINPTIIETQFSLAQQLMLPIRDMITWQTDGNPGLTRNTPGAATVAMSAIAFTSSSATADASDNFDMTTRTHTISTKGCDLIVHLDTLLGGVGDIEGMLGDSLAKADQLKLETDLMALYTESNSDVGALGSGISYGTHFAGALELLAQNAAEGRKSWIFPSSQFGAFLTNAQFSDWNKSALQILNQDIVLPAGFAGISPAGVYCYWSNSYTSAAGDHGIMFTQPAIKLIERLPFIITRIDTELYGGERCLKISGTHSYGIAGTRGSSATTNPWIVDTVH